MTLICPLLPVRVRKRGTGKPPWERVYGFLSPVFDTGDKMSGRGQNGDKLSPGFIKEPMLVLLVIPCLAAGSVTGYYFLRKNNRGQNEKPETLAGSGQGTK